MKANCIHDCKYATHRGKKINYLSRIYGMACEGNSVIDTYIELFD